jgi:plasmid stability protein
MKNITLAIDEEVLRAARRYAANHDTTVNALVRDYLTRLVTFEEKAAKARAELVELAKKSEARMGSWKWNREDAYEGRLFPRHEHSDLRGFGEPDGGEKENKGD